MPYAAWYIMRDAWEEGMYREVDHSCFGLYLLAWWWTLAAKCACDDTSQTLESKQLFLETFFPSGLKLLNLLKKKVYAKTLFPRKSAPSAYHVCGHFSIETLYPSWCSFLSVFLLSESWRAFHCCKGSRIAFHIQLGERDKQSSDLTFKAGGSLLSACHGAA